MATIAANIGSHGTSFEGVHIVGKPANSRWDLCCQNGLISSVDEHETGAIHSNDNRFLSPSLCHPHIHLDKCFLLSHPKYADLEIEKGDFAEALSLTSTSII
jgi:cytosine/adenosine deaminase-related metal-dependent hydrolase